MLGRNVDDDILILLPSSKAEDGSDVYHLEGYVCCFPAGFSLPQKINLPLVSPDLLVLESGTRVLSNHLNFPLNSCTVCQC